jgi:PTS system N-acetylgalactosamine-specific IIA component
MSEAAGARGILLAHGAMAEGVVDAVRSITGADASVLVPVSNRGLSPQALVEAVRARVGDGPTLLFTDLPSGSCSVAARMLQHDVPGLVILSGVNLPLLLDFVMNRTLPIEQLVPRLLERGRAAIGCSPGGLEVHADRASARR